MKATTFLFIFTFLLSSSLYSADQSDGCGPGLAVTQKTTLSATSSRKTTDVALFPVKWLAFTSGTSGCAQHKIVKKFQESFELINGNYYQIGMEMSQGNGELLYALGKSLECNNEYIPTLNKILQKNFETIYPLSEDNSVQLLENTIQLLKADKKAEENCRHILKA